MRTKSKCSHWKAPCKVIPLPAHTGGSYTAGVFWEWIPLWRGEDSTALTMTVQKTGVPELCDHVLHVESILLWICLWVCQLSIHCIILVTPTLTTLRFSYQLCQSEMSQANCFWRAQLSWPPTEATRTKSRPLKLVWKMFVYVISCTNAPSSVFSLLQCLSCSKHRCSYFLTCEDVELHLCSLR